MEFDIKNWANLSDEDRQVIIIKIAYEYDLGFKLSYNMPSGHETDNGYYSKEDNMFYFNYMLMKDDNTLATIYNLFYEIRKVMQIMNIDSTPIIQKSLNYTFMYDGSVYRNDGDIQEVYLDGERKYLKQVYISAPNTYDANKYAYNKVYEYVKDDEALVQELDDIYDYWKPTFEFFSEDELEATYTEIFKEIDSKF